MGVFGAALFLGGIAGVYFSLDADPIRIKSRDGLAASVTGIVVGFVLMMLFGLQVTNPRPN